MLHCLLWPIKSKFTTKNVNRSMNTDIHFYHSINIRSYFYNILLKCIPWYDNLQHFSVIHVAPTKMSTFIYVYQPYSRVAFNLYFFHKLGYIKIKRTENDNDSITNICCYKTYVFNKGVNGFLTRTFTICL